MTHMVEVQIDSVRVSLTNQQRIVMLRESGHERFLPIWIGPYEAEAITISLQEIEVARPQTHDLLLQALAKIGARLIRVEVVELKRDVFYGNLVVEIEGKLHDVDARPSDSIALAVRAHVPILVNSEILREAGIIPEGDIQSVVLDGEGDASGPEVEQADHEESKKRLSLFEDFLQNVNLDDLDDSGGEDDNPPPEDNEPTGRDDIQPS